MSINDFPDPDELLEEATEYRGIFGTKADYGPGQEPDHYDEILCVFAGALLEFPELANTWATFLLGGAYRVLAAEDPEDRVIRLAALHALIVDWIDDIADKVADGVYTGGDLEDEDQEQALTPEEEEAFTALLAQFSKED